MLLQCRGKRGQGKEGTGPGGGCGDCGRSGAAKRDGCDERVGRWSQKGSAGNQGKSGCPGREVVSAERKDDRCSQINEKDGRMARGEAFPDPAEAASKTRYCGQAAR